MALIIKCKCGKRLRLTDKVAGKKIACPHCRRPFRIPAERFRAAAKPGAPGARPAAREPTPQPVALDGEPTGFDLLNDLSADAASAPADEPPRVVEIQTEVQLDYAGGDEAVTGPRADMDAIQPPKRSFWGDLAYAFVYPFGSLGNAFNTVMILVFNVIAQFICFGFVIELWMASVYMNIVSDAASGSDDFKGASIEGGLLDAILFPFLRFIGSFALAMLPSIVYSMLVFANVLAPSAAGMIGATALGVFMWPMIMLLASLSAWDALLKPKLLAITIGRTILPYLTIWVALGLAFGLYLASTAAQDVLVQLGINTKSLKFTILGVAGAMILNTVLSVYFMIVGMRLIGLYYLHNKRRFAFTFE